nr:MAG TPA: hypothetical protein [Crassvirales sp.]
MIAFFFENYRTRLRSILPLRTPSGNQLPCWCPRGRGIFLIRERWVPQ